VAEQSMSELVRHVVGLEQAHRFDVHADGDGELRSCYLCRVRFEYPGLRLDNLAERPVGDAFPVGERAPLPPEDDFRLVVDPAPELRRQTRLADTGAMPVIVTSCVVDSRSVRA
jgi:hypothetical protein